MSYLSIDHVSKYFPGREGSSARSDQADAFCVFTDVSLSIAEGEFVTIIGHSGCGKSTLLNVVAGFEAASSGGVILDGKEVTAPGLDRMMVFQTFALMPWLTTFNNVKIAVKAAHPSWDKQQVRDYTQKYIDMMGLRGAEDKRPAFLSGGMRQRVGLARAFAVQPKVLLLDEPFAQIDALTRGVIQDELIRMWTATKTTVFMVTHDVDEAILLSDRIALMTNGPAARLTESLDVTIARPRSRETIIDMPEYIQLRNHILHFLLQASDRRDQTATTSAPISSASPRPRRSAASG